MNNNPDSLIANEANCFSRYLLGHDATNEVIARYGTALVTLELADPDSPFEIRLISAAAKHPLVTAALDTATALFAKKCILRKRLYVLAGILETDPEYADFFLKTPTSKLALLLSLLWIGVRAAIMLVVGVPLLLVIRGTP